MKNPLTVVVLNGWSSKCREEKTRTHRLVKRELDRAGADYELLGLRASFLYARARRVRRFILDHSGSGRVLVCVGKSLGGRNVVKRVLNHPGDLRHDKIYLLTIDPNWPETWDLTPNLNRSALRLQRPVTMAWNVYYVTPEPRTQAGARLIAPPGVPCVNEPVTDTDHIKIVGHPITEKFVRKALQEALYI